MASGSAGPLPADPLFFCLAGPTPIRCRFARSPRGRHVVRHATHLARSDPIGRDGRSSCGIPRRRSGRRPTPALKAAVHRARPLSRAGVLERMFTFAFSKLVYPQIWEDPVVDMKALEIGPGHEVIAIASGGCNVLSYLTADPGRRHRGRPQRRAYRARQAQDLRAAESARLSRRFSASSAAPTPAPTSASTTSVCAPGSIPRRAPIGTSAGRSAADASASSPAISTATACSAISSARATRSPACTGSTRRSFSRPGRSRSSGALRGATRADLRQAARPLDDEAAGLALRPRHSAGAIRGARRRFAQGHRRGAEPAGRAARLRLSPSPTITSPGRRSAAATRRARTRRCRPICSGRISTPSAAGRIGCAMCSARSPRPCAIRPPRASTATCCSTRRTG